MARKKKAPPADDMNEALRGVTTREELAAAFESRGIEFTPELEQQLKVVAMRDLAVQEDTARAFAAFYELVTGNELPWHAEEWVEGIYEAHENKQGILIEAFRGSTKTTTISVFVAWRIGKEPHRANLIVRASDDAAQQSAMKVADIIQNNDAWKMVFPYVVPDKDIAWGSNGYEVKRTDMAYSDWRRMCASRTDPTLVGLGYRSQNLIGKHPDGVLDLDDIHDQNNTSSSRELENVMQILRGTIFPMVTPSTWQIVIGTPWVEGDAIQYIAATGQYKHIKTPVYIPNENGKGTEIDGFWVKLAWPQMFDAAEIRKQKALNGTLQFARMYLLDLTMAKQRWFRYQAYPASMIRWDWVIMAGADPAGVGNAAKLKEGKLDYFAMCYTAKSPNGGAVVIDGVLDRCTQGESEQYMRRAQSVYMNLQRIAVESDGKGEDFISMITRNPGLKLQPVRSKKRSKQDRYKMMQPWLEAGIVKISDAETPFLNELRRELDNYPYVENDDALDALFWSLVLMPDVLNVPELYRFGEDSEIEYTSWRSRKRSKQQNPYMALTR